MKAILLGAVMSVVINAISVFIPTIGIRGIKDGAKQGLEMMALVFSGILLTVLWAFQFYNCV